MLLRLNQFFQFDTRIHNCLQEYTRSQNKVLHNHVPPRIVQYGIGGTATTLQFQILCVLMAIIHEDEVNSVGCYFNKQPSAKYTVVKTHVIRDIMIRSLPLNSWIFITSSNSLPVIKKQELELTKRKIKNMKIEIPYIADISMVSKRGHFIAYEYQSIFRVSDKQMEKVTEYLRYWDILRVCCGKQMSADWRWHLLHTKHFTPHHELHSSSYPACEMYNISAVEQLFIKTNIYQKYAHGPSLHDIIGKISNVDGDMDGHYCERCSKNISEKYLGFNQNCA
ncbi:uncharacterized protein LOC123562512 [Mercenaria mercenaria]|uniref:uncharacterized protein LOC123562512 n=1 Tax=Mercenaria mercenaria TaxID=6596 RepID=UPI00234F906D|nr:uncharacterized protein LOC123562512 [Mercenaria mercenaria]